jgi:Flp pilus assembly protein TadD
MELIQKAVRTRPNDGAFVDSLGWAFYRLKKFPEAVKQLEKAVMLKPGDPTINGHLGDAYWRVGRLLEAEFQWKQALDLKPSPEEKAELEKKLKEGLSKETSTRASLDAPKGPALQAK